MSSDSLRNTPMMPDCHLNIVGYFDNGEPPELELIGSSKELLKFVNILLSGISTQCRLEMASTSPYPYDGYLEFLEVVFKTSKLEITNQDKKIIFMGGKKELEGFARDVKWLADNPAHEGNLLNHTHFEYFENGFAYLSPTTAPLVISVQ
jgi:hypothetical protein